MDFFYSNNQAWSDVSDVKDILVNNISQVWRSGGIKLSVTFPIPCKSTNCDVTSGLMHESFVSTAPPPTGMVGDSNPSLFRAHI